MKKVRCEDKGKSCMGSVFHTIKYKQSIIVRLVTKIVTPKIDQIHSNPPNLNNFIESIIGNKLAPFSRIIGGFEQ